MPKPCLTSACELKDHIFRLLNSPHQVPENPLLVNEVAARNQHHSLAAKEHVLEAPSGRRLLTYKSRTGYCPSHKGLGLKLLLHSPYILRYAPDCLPFWLTLSYQTGPVIALNIQVALNDSKPGKSPKPKR